MIQLRRLLAIAILALFAVLYGLSQWAYFEGRAPAYAKAIDSPAMTFGMLGLLVLVVSFAFWPPPPEPKERE